MLVNATPPETRDEQQLRQVQRFALLLGGHTCAVYERESGTSAKPTFTCNVCASTRAARLGPDIEQWHFMRARRGAELKALVAA